MVSHLSSLILPLPFIILSVIILSVMHLIDVRNNSYMIFLSLLFVLSLIACVDQQTQREKAEVVARRWLSINDEKIAVAINEAAEASGELRTKTSDMRAAILDSLENLRLIVSQDQDETAKLWHLPFRSEFMLNGIRISYSINVSVRLGLISSVEKAILRDLTVGNNNIPLNKELT